MDLGQMLKTGAREYDLELDDEQISKFMRYSELLVEWNKKINLTAITEGSEIIKKHFLDSISIIKSGVIKDKMKLIDVGTGAGFPGIPLKIIKRDIDVTLLDSLNKRINFLNEIILKLELESIRAIHGRAEEFARKPDYREGFDIATARAVASLSMLSEFCIPYVKPGGYFIAMKGPSIEEELRDGRNAIGTLGGRINDIFSVKITGEDLEHRLVVVEKIKSTDEKYPRKFAQIEKKPIK